MAEFFADYGLFLLKTVTLVAAILAVVAGIVVLVSRNKEHAHDRLEIKKINDKFEENELALKQATLSKAELKKLEKELKLKHKVEKKADTSGRERAFLLQFDGDVRASAVASLREEISAVLAIATDKDEVIINLSSPGGMVHAYGLASSQLARIRERKIPLTVTVDKVAASGGYMMACVADKILAAPFAVVGSIGVVAQIPNFNRLLKKHDIDYEQITAGQYKRTLTVFGENTDQAREKFKEDIEDTHRLFKEFVSQYRPSLDMDKVSTGEHWFGLRALELNLVDALKTSDDYLMEKSRSADVFQVSFVQKKKLSSKFAGLVGKTTERLMQAWQDKHFLP